MCWISKAELLRDYPIYGAQPTKGVTPVDAPGCSPYLNRPLRRYEDVATGHAPAARPGPDGAQGAPIRDEKAKEA